MLKESAQLNIDRNVTRHFLLVGLLTIMSAWCLVPAHANVGEPFEALVHDYQHVNQPNIVIVMHGSLAVPVQVPGLSDQCLRDSGAAECAGLSSVDKLCMVSRTPKKCSRDIEAVIAEYDIDNFIGEPSACMRQILDDVEPYLAPYLVGQFRYSVYEFLLVDSLYANVDDDAIREQMLSEVGTHGWKWGMSCYADRYGAETKMTSFVNEFGLSSQECVFLEQMDLGFHDGRRGYLTTDLPPHAGAFAKIFHALLLNGSNPECDGVTDESLQAEFQIDSEGIGGGLVYAYFKVESALQGAIDMRPDLALLYTYLKLSGKTSEAAAEIESRRSCAGQDDFFGC